MTTMNDIKMDDIKMDDTGDLYIGVVNGQHDIALVTKGEALVQRVKVTLKYVLGEYWWNKNFGIPYFQEILGIKGAKPRVAAFVLRRKIEAIPGVIAVDSIAFEFDKETRELSVKFHLVGEYEVDTEIEETLHE